MHLGVGVLNFENYKSRKIWFGILAVVIPIVWALVHLLFEKPVWMIVVGGVSTSIILLVVLYAAIVFKKERKNSDIKTGGVYEVAFWLSSAMILFVGIWSVLSNYI